MSYRVFGGGVFVSGGSYSFKNDPEIVEMRGDMTVGDRSFKNLKITSKDSEPLFTDAPIKIIGPCDRIESVSGQVVVNGNAIASALSTSGSVRIGGDVMGSASSVSGSVSCASCGSSSTVSGSNRFNSSW